MSKRQTLMLLGVWVMILLYLGFGERVDKILLLITGALIIGIAYRLKTETSENQYKHDKPYVDNINRE